MKKDKIEAAKTFVKDHWKPIVAGTVIVGCTIALICISKKDVKIPKINPTKMDPKELVKTSPEELIDKCMDPGMADWYKAFIHMDGSHGGMIHKSADGIPVNELGKLGEIFIENGAEATRKVKDIIVSFTE